MACGNVDDREREKRNQFSRNSPRAWRHSKVCLVYASQNQKGFRYRKNDKSVFGRPDFTFKRYKIAIFVDGEFWHGKEWELRKHDFKSRQEFWITKIENNIMRDQLVSKTLGLVGWKVLRFWSKEVLRNLDSCMSKIEQTINESKQKTTNEI